MIRTVALLGLFILCGCATTGTSPRSLTVNRRWARHTIDFEYLGGRRIHRFAPMLYNTTVITGNAVDGLVAYDRETGAQRWRLDVREGVEAGAYLADDNLYFGASDGQLYAVHPETGQVQWTYPLKAEGLARPFAAAGVLYVLGGNSVAHALNAKTGKLIWQYNRREAGNLSVRGGTQPAVYGDLVLFGFADGTLVALNKSSGALIWETSLNRNKRFRDVDASPVIDGNMVYVSSYDGALYALKPEDGKILWSVEEGGFEPVLVNGSSLFFSTSSGKVMAIDKNSGKVLWSHVNPKGISTAPTLFKGVIMVGEYGGALRFLDIRTGDFLAEFAPGRGVTSRATVDRDRGEVYFMSADANLFALNMTWKRKGVGWPWEY